MRFLKIFFSVNDLIVRRPFGISRVTQEVLLLLLLLVLVVL